MTYERKTAADAAPAGDDRPGFHWPAGSAWWDQPLPTLARDAKGQASGINHVGWWDRPRTTALVLWLGHGSMRALALALTGMPKDRRSYALDRTRARWVADLLADRQPGEVMQAASRILAAPLPADRLRRVEQGAARLERVAELVPAMPQGSDPARWVFRRLSVVQAVSEARLWPTLCDPDRQIPTKDERGHAVLGSIVPPRRKALDLDRRQADAEGVFG